MGRAGADRRVGGDSAGGGQGAVYVENQIWGLLPPWLAALGLFLVGGAAHLAWGNPDRVGLVSAFLGAAGVGLTVLTVWVSRPRHPVIRTLSTVTVALAGLWMILATSWGWGNGLWWIYPLPAFTLCVAWNIKRLLRGAGNDAGQAEVTASPWGGVADKVSLLRSTILQQDQIGSRIKVQAQIEPGTTQAQAAQEGAVLAGLMQTPPGNVTVTGNLQDASKVEVSIVPMDMLTRTFYWPGPSFPGTSIADHPIRLGTYQDGDPVEIMLPGKRGVKVVSHILIQGMTGAGKSELLQEICDEVLSRCDTELEYIDTGDKAEQTLAPLRSGLSRASTTDEEAKAHLRDLEREIAPRAAKLQEQGLREWAKGCGLSFKVVVIDEAGDSIAADKKAFTRLARKTRSVGILLVVAGQNHSNRTMPVDARKNFGTGICCGIAEAGDAGWVLADSTIEAGAQPWLWGNRKPGYFYIQDGGIPEERWPIAARACLTDPDEVQAAVEANAMHRWKGEALELAVAKPDVDDDEDGFFPPPPMDADDGEGEIDEASAQRELAGAAYEVPDSMAAELEQLDPDAPLPTSGIDMEMKLGPTSSKPTSETAAQLLEQMIDDLGAGGPREFRRADLVKSGALMTTRRSRSWLTGELKRHVAAGRLEVVGDPAEGVYRHREPAYA